MVTSLVSANAVFVCKSKHLTKQLLRRQGVPVAEGKHFTAAEYAKALDYFESRAWPVVVKPNGGHGGQSVTSNIRDRESFQSAWRSAVGATAAKSSIIVENYVSGLDIRAFVVGDRVAGASTRLPAFVVGAGARSIRQLVHEKAEARKRHAYLSRMPISVDEVWLAAQGYSLDSTLPDGEFVTLNGTVNLHQGGENMDVTELMSDEVKGLAVAAANAIPGLTLGGVDLLVKSLDSSAGAVVIEINTAANISVHHAPAYGNPVDVGRAIVDEILRRSGMN